MNFDFRILSYYKEIEEIKNGNIPYPKYMSLYPTNACQFNCSFCDYKALNLCKVRELTKEEVTYILGVFKKYGGETLDLCGGGEPLMHSEIEYIFKYIKKLGLEVGLVTNGLNIDKNKKPELYDLILDTCSYVRISFESGSSDTFKKIKKKDRFVKILNNVGKLIEDKKDNLEVSYKYTIPNNYSLLDIKNAIMIADYLKFDNIQFKAVCNCDDKLKDSDRKSLNKFINKIKVDTKVICSLKKTERLPEDSHVCCALRLLIDNYGNIYICCYYQHREDSHKIGNLFSPKFTPFEKIWGSRDHKKKMENIDYKECNLYDCRFLRYNKQMQELMKNKKLRFI